MYGKRLVIIELVAICLAGKGGDQWNGSLLGYDNPIQDSILTDLQDEVLLLQFNSIETDDDYALMFGDCGALYFVISREDLLARRFDKIRFELQCC